MFVHFLYVCYLLLICTFRMFIGRAGSMGLG